MSRTQLTDAEKATIRRLRAEGLTLDEIMAATGRSSGAVRAYWAQPELQAAGRGRTVVERGRPVEPPRAEPAEEEYDPVAEERERARRHAKEAELKLAVKELAFREWLDATIRDAVADLRLPAGPPPKLPPRPAGRVHTRGLILHLSDWHFAELVAPDRTFGVDQYNADETRRRAWRVTKAFLASVDDWEASGRFRYPVLDVAVNGDLTTGVIHNLDKHTDAPHVMSSTLQCAVLLAQVLRDLAGRFQTVNAHCTVGNHGRRDPRTKRVDPKQVGDSFDWMVYATARELLRDVPNVVFDIPDAVFTVYEVGGKTVYQGHGDALRQNLGTVGYSLLAAVSRLGTTFSRVGKPLDLVLFGHWHKRMMVEVNGVTTYVNRSLIGTQELGLNSYGETAVAGQEAYVIDPEHGAIENHSILAHGASFTGEYPPAF